MKQKKRNKFWTFCFSFIPGAAEMYMGFMKMGLSLMSVFATVMCVVAVLNIGPLVFVAIVSWFYSFFHARNLAKIDEIELGMMEDTYLFEINQFQTDRVKNLVANQKAIAYVLIVLGVYLIWKAMIHTCYVIFPSFFDQFFWGFEETVTRLVIGFGILLIGVQMIKNKKAELYAQIHSEEQKHEDKFQVFQEQDESENTDNSVENELAVLQEETENERNEETSET